MNEETTDRVVRALIATIPILVILLAFLITFAFPRGIRISLGRRALWLAPPAVPIYSYFRMTAQLRRANAEVAAILAEMRDIHGSIDSLVVELALDTAGLATNAGVVEVSQDPNMQIVFTLLAGITDNDKVHREAFQDAATVIDELLAQPMARTIPELFEDLYQASMHTRLALQSTRLRNRAFFQSFGSVKAAVLLVLEQTQRQAAMQATIDAISAMLQPLDDLVDGLDDRAARVEQPGRKPRGRPTTWTREKTQTLYADYLAWTGTYNKEFLQRHGLKNRTQMYELFDRYGLRRKPGELTDN